jgi:hypothetical protein
MSRESEILELENRLKELDSMISNRESLSKDQEIVQLEGKLAQLDQQIAMQEDPKSSNPELSFTDKALQIARGGAKTIGGLADIGRTTVPTVESVKKRSLDTLIRNLEGVPGREAELEALKQEYAQNEGALNQSKQQQFVKNVDEIAGKDLTPTTAGGKFREKLGEFGIPLPVQGGLAASKAAPAIAAVSTGLRELGLDESYSDLIAAIGVPNAKALAKLPGKVLKKLGDYIATIGIKEYREAGNVEKAAKFLQEKVGDANIPKVVENIENYETPFKGNPAEGEAAYQPLTADIADDVGISQYHRAKAENIPEVGRRRQTNAEVLQREIDNIASKEASPQVSQEFAAAEKSAYEAGLEAEEVAARQTAEGASKEFNKTAKIDDAGRTTQDYLVDRVSGIQKEAQNKASPLYKAAESKSLDNKLSNTFKYIEEEMKDLPRTSETSRNLAKAKKWLKESKSEEVKKAAKEREKIISETKNRYKDDPSMLAIALKEVKDVPHGTYSVKKLDKAKQAISEMLEEIPLSERNKRRPLVRLLENLEKDMESIPEIFEARRVYQEVMKPANVITENPVLSKLIHQENGYTKPFTVTHAEIPKRIISGSRSIEGAKALMSEAAGLGTKEHKQMLNTIKSYINSEILSTFVETSGKINPDKFNAWSKSNPGAFILYPELKTKLKNLKNAQTHVDRVITQNKELLSNFYKESMDKILGPKFGGINPDRIAGRILDSTNSEAVMSEAMDLLSKDKTGNAAEGLRRGLVNHLKSKFKSDKFTFATLNDYLTKNKKALSRAFTPEQMEVLEKSKDVLKDIAKMEGAGKGTNSDTIPKLFENIAEKSGGKASEALFGFTMPSWVGSVLGSIEKIKDMGKLKYLEQALMEPDYAKFLLQKDVKTKKDFFDSLKNKEDFGKWLRDSEGPFKLVGDTFKDLGKNFGITSQNVGKVLINDDLK